MGAELREFKALAGEGGEDFRHSGVEFRDGELMQAGIDAVGLDAGDGEERGGIDCAVGVGLACGPGDGELDDVLAADGGDELVGGAEGDDLAVIHDGDAVREALGLIHVVGGEDDSAAGRKPALSAQNQYVHEAGARYIDFVVPGLLGMNLMGSAMWGMGFAIVEARQKKLLKRMIASPMPRWQYLASFLLSRIFILVIEVGFFLGFARITFGVPFRGPIWQLVLVCVLTSLAFSALALLVASRARTIEAASGLMNLTMMPMWILSGIFFSATRFPAIIQPLVHALPLTAAIDAMRGNMLQGQGLNQLLLPVLTLVFWFVAPFAIALKIFRWK